MDYEEKYKAALGWMQSLYGGLHGVTKEDAEKYFPELKESEDEKMRKSIIYALQNGGFYSSDKTDEAIAWLEKQDHMLYPDRVVEWLKHCNITDCDMRNSIIPDSSPTSIPHRVRWFSEEFIEQFKKDFGL